MHTMLRRLGLSVAAVAYLTRDCGIDSLREAVYLDGDYNVENTIKDVTSPGGTVTVGTGSSAVTSHNNGISVFSRYVANLKLGDYYLKHME
jgi:hypothetical protein